MLIYPEFVQASLDTLNIRIFIKKFLGKIAYLVMCTHTNLWLLWKTMTSIELLAIKVEINFRMGMLLQWNWCVCFHVPLHGQYF